MLFSPLFTLFFYLSTMLTIFTSELTISYLRLSSNKNLQPVALCYSYCAMTAEEKKNALFLGEGCYTILKNENDCALVGPLRPYQLIVLNLKNGPTIVAHASPQSSILDLLHTIINTYPETNFQETTGELFTTDYSNYKNFSPLYENRSQIDELRHNKNLIIKAFGIPEVARKQIRARKFNPEKEHFGTVKYVYAQWYVWIKRYDKQEQATIYNICPITENCWGDTSHLSMKEILEKLPEILDRLMEPNPFFKDEICLKYGFLPFEYIENKKE